MDTFGHCWSFVLVFAGHAGITLIMSRRIFQPNAFGQTDRALSCYFQNAIAVVLVKRKCACAWNDQARNIGHS